MRTPPPGGSGLTFQFSCQSVKLGIQCPHLGTFLFSGHWNIGDVYIHASGLVPGWSGFSFASLSESNMPGLAKPRPAKPSHAQRHHAVPFFAVYFGTLASQG
jgi:hypothetical protein